MPPVISRCWYTCTRSPTLSGSPVGRTVSGCRLRVIVYPYTVANALRLSVGRIPSGCRLRVIVYPYTVADVLRLSVGRTASGYDLRVIVYPYTVADVLRLSVGRTASGYDLTVLVYRYQSPTFSGSLWVVLRPAMISRCWYTCTRSPTLSASPVGRSPSGRPARKSFTVSAAVALGGVSFHLPKE